MEDAALQLEGIGKRYHRRTSLRGMLTELAGLAEGPDAFWALRDLNLSVARGECLGIVGHNGAGKSTLLKILSRITPPTTGRYRLAGRLGSLIEVGAGFHPELTGRENVYLAGAIHGLGRHEVAAKFDEIVEFAGLREFLDMPVKHYSSGMFVRLGFSVAVHTQPDVLLVDEVLAVGDLAFRSKCMEHFTLLRNRGCAVVLVSHNLEMIHKFCDRVGLLNQGRVEAVGEPPTVLDAYRAAGQGMPQSGPARELPDAVVRFTNLEVVDGEGRLLPEVKVGQPMILRLRYMASRAVSQVTFAVGITDGEGSQLTGFRTDLSGLPLFDLPAGPGHIDVRIEAMHLLPGGYKVDAAVQDFRTLKVYGWRGGIARFQVLGGFVARGICHLPHQWSHPMGDGGAQP